MSPGRLNRRQLIAGVAGLAMARTARAQETQIIRGGVPLAALPHVPDRLLDTSGDGWEAAWLRSLIYDTPLRPGATGEVVAGVGISFGVDPNTGTLEIAPRAGVLFSTGEPVTASAIARSIERARTHATSGDAWRWQRIERVETIEDELVRIRLSQPDATLPATLASPLVPVTVAGEGEPSAGVDRLPIGSGPFVPASAVSGSLRFRVNRMHWVIGQPRFDGCMVTGIADDIERTSRLVTGLVDIVPDVPLLDIPLLDNDPGVGLYGGASRRQCAVVVRVNRAPLDDVRVRQLIAVSIDREALVKGATAETGVPSSTLFPPDHWAGLTEPVDGQRLTIQEIRDRLVELGLQPGWRLRLICPDGTATLANTAILLQEQLATIGCAVSVELLNANEITNARIAGDFDLMMASLPLWVDPHEVVHPWLHSEGTRNDAGFRDVRMDRLLDMARSTAEPARRGVLYGNVQRIVSDQVPLIPLFEAPWFDGVRSRIAGWSLHLPPSGRGVASAWFPRP